MKETAEKLNAALDKFLNDSPKPADWSFKPSPDKWSAKEVLGHLIDSAHVNLMRFVRCTYEEKFRLVYQQNEWVAAQCYQQANKDELLTLWNLVNRQIATTIANYPADRRKITCDAGQAEPKFHTVEFLAADYVDHMQHHLNQIIALSHGH
jgi:hypothetical protein